MTNQQHDTNQSRWSKGLTWLGQARLLAAVVVIGVPVLCFGVLSIGFGWVSLPVVGAVVAVTVSKIGARFETNTCWTCGTDLANEDAGVHGVICPGCGALNQHNPRLLTMRDRA